MSLRSVLLALEMPGVLEYGKDILQILPRLQFQRNVQQPSSLSLSTLVRRTQPTLPSGASFIRFQGHPPPPVEPAFVPVENKDDCSMSTSSTTLASAVENSKGRERNDTMNSLGQHSPRSLSPTERELPPVDAPADSTASSSGYTRSTAAMDAQRSPDDQNTSEMGPVATAAKPKKVGRPSNAFILYRSEQLRIFKLNGTKKQTQSELSKVIGVMWKACGATEKEIWEGHAAVVKQKHSLEYPDYRTKRVLAKPRSASSRSVDAPSAPSTRRSAPSQAKKPSTSTPAALPLCHPVPCRFPAPLSLDWQHPFSPPSAAPPPRTVSNPSIPSYTPPRTYSPHQPVYYAFRPTSPYPSPLSVSYGVDKIDQFPFPHEHVLPQTYDYYQQFPIDGLDYLQHHHQPQQQQQQSHLHLAQQNPYASQWALPTPGVESAPRDDWSSHLGYSSGAAATRQMMEQEQGMGNCEWLVPMATTADLMDSVGDREREREMGLGLDISSVVPFL